MNNTEVIETVNKIFKNVFNRENKFSIEEIKEKFAFDVKIPKMVYDSTTNEETWATSIHGNKFITLNNMEKKDQDTGWMLEKRNIDNLEELVSIWNSINLITTERVYDSTNVSKSDTIYRSENVYASNDIREGKNIVFCDGSGNCDYMLASQRSALCQYCIRTDDSGSCSNSYSVVCSSKINNCLFIQDCSDLYECIFCAHISSKKFCIGNMQFEEEEYYQIKELIIDWILSQ